MWNSRKEEDGFNYCHWILFFKHAPEVIWSRKNQKCCKKNFTRKHHVMFPDFLSEVLCLFLTSLFMKLLRLVSVVNPKDSVFFFFQGIINDMVHILWMIPCKKNRPLGIYICVFADLFQLRSK